MRRYWPSVHIWQDSTWIAALNSGQHTFPEDVDEQREFREEQQEKKIIKGLKALTYKKRLK